MRRGHGSPPVLSEVPHELSTDAHSKECKRSPQQFIPAGFPLHDQPPTGTEDSDSPLTTPDMVRFGRVLLTSVKYPSKLFRYQESPYFPKIYCIRISEPDNAYKKLRHGRNMLKFRTIPQTVISYPKMTPSTP